MKHLTKQTNKWILSAFLFAAIGSQYYFSSYSNNSGMVEMSLEAASSDQTEARTVFCDVCTVNGITFSGPDSLKDTEKFLEFLKTKKEATRLVVVAGAPASAAATAAAPARVETAEQRAARIAKEKEDEIQADCKYKGSIAEKNRCIREARADARKEEREAKEEERRLAKQEKDDKKKEKEQAKKDKLREEKDIRNEKFEEQAEKIANSCKNEGFSCFSDGFTALLSDFSGTRSVDVGVVNKAYTQYLDKDLKAALRGTPEARQQALAIIESITGELPKEHRIVKEKTIDALKAATISRGVEVNDKYRQADQLRKMADQLSKAGRAAEAIQLYQQADQLGYVEAPKAKDEFIADSRIYGEAVVRNLEKSSDTTSLEYFNKNFMPDVKKVMANLESLTGINMSALGKTVSTTVTQPGTTTNRGNRGGRTAVSTASGNITDGVNFGTPSKTSNGNRGGK